jgi:hypothetical protein
MRRTGLSLILTALLAGPAAAQTPAAAQPPACAGAEHGQFDFWVGAWDVYRTGQDKPVARSLIEKLYGGCAVRENWMPFSGTPGGSLNNYVPEEKAWKQTWVDASNARVDFKGGMVGDRMVLTGFWKGANGPGQDGLVRMTYGRQAGGAVRQFGEISTDQGKKWAPFFDFTYRPSRSASAVTPSD